MTEMEFRFNHSKLLEYYQLIEMRLRGLCADLMADDERDWFERLSDYDLDSFGALLIKLRDMQKEKQIVIFSQDDFKALHELRENRNYWAHECFGGLRPITFRKGEVCHQEDAERVICDLNKAIEWDEKIAICIRSQLK